MGDFKVTKAMTKDITCTISSHFAKTTSGYRMLNCSKNGAMFLHGPHPVHNAKKARKGGG